MPYRTNAIPAASDARDAAEVATFAREAKVRRRRAALGVGAMLVGSMGALAVIASGRPQKPMLRCHQVEVRWENAPWVPPNRWTACREP
jgi:hypothetical protein